MGAVVVVARRRKDSDALSGSALLSGAQAGSGRIQIGLGGGGLSIGLSGASQGGLASHLCRAGLLLCSASGREGLVLGVTSGRAGFLGGASGGRVAVERRCGGGQDGVFNAGRRHGAGPGGCAGCSASRQRDGARDAVLGGW
ncbi:glycine-rich cell wall structural protein-like [Panicum hallii]|jgi:hypothetical protein|uniref:glycine-rich cell wall structural protein-like n=1 Tax=Panicum hallii TaxID=206008 RepID=UPI000DF4E8B4|nr:glycine-rich cell wall structural protein-like [Panicum hallii]